MGFNSGFKGLILPADITYKAYKITYILRTYKSN